MQVDIWDLRTCTVARTLKPGASGRKTGEAVASAPASPHSTPSLSVLLPRAGMCMAVQVLPTASDRLYVLGAFENGNLMLFDGGTGRTLADTNMSVDPGTWLRCRPITPTLHASHFLSHLGAPARTHQRCAWRWIARGAASWGVPTRTFASSPLTPPYVQRARHSCRANVTWAVPLPVV